MHHSMGMPYYGGGYGYGGGFVAQPGDGLIRDGDQDWLDDLETLTFNKSCCLSGKVVGETRGGKSIEFDSKSGGCSGGTYHALVKGEDKPVAIFGAMGGCCGTTRYTQCPPGREVLSAIIRKEGYGKRAPTFYTSHIKNNKGAGGTMLLRRSMNHMSCVGSMPMCDMTGRILAEMDGPGCCSCCGGIITIKFDENATAMDKLAVIDCCLALIDSTMANPYRWCFLLIFVIPLLVVLFMIVLSSLGAIGYAGRTTRPPYTTTTSTTTTMMP